MNISDLLKFSLNLFPYEKMQNLILIVNNSNPRFSNIISTFGYFLLYSICFESSMIKEKLRYRQHIKELYSLYLLYYLNLIHSVQN